AHVREGARGGGRQSPRRQPGPPAAVVRGLAGGGGSPPLGAARLVLNAGRLDTSPERKRWGRPVACAPGLCRGVLPVPGSLPTVLNATLAASRRPGFSLPQPFYTRPEIFQLEMRRTFRRRWLCACV